MSDTEDDQAELMRGIARSLSALFNGDRVEDPPVGFVVLAFNSGKPGMTNYISNCDRRDMIAAMRETADRLERQLREEAPTPRLH